MELTVGNTYTWRYRPTISDGPDAPAEGEVLKVVMLQLPHPGAPAKGYAKMRLLPSGREMLVLTSELGLYAIAEIELPMGHARVSNSCDHG